jgi:hypothetical protein
MNVESGKPGIGRLENGLLSTLHFLLAHLTHGAAFYPMTILKA